MKSKYQFQSLMLVSMMILSTTAFAHPSHDHTHWFSGGIHLIFFGGLSLVLIAFGLLWSSKIKSAKEKSTRKQNRGK